MEATDFFVRCIGFERGRVVSPGSETNNSDSQTLISQNKAQL